MKDELVFYDNRINTLDFANLDKKDLNLFMAIISQVPNAKKEEQLVIRVDYEKLKELSDLGRCSVPELRKKADELTKKLGAIAITWETPEQSVYFTIFQYTKWDATTNTLSVIVSDIFRNMIDLMRVKSNFTVLELRKYINLTSKAAKGLYMLLAQYKSTGVIYNLSVSNLKRVLCVAKGMDSKYIISRYLIPALKMLKEEGCIEEYEKPQATYGSGQGNPLKAVTIYFTFAGEKKIINESSGNIKQIEEAAKVLGVPVETLLALKSNPAKEVKQEPKPITKVEPVEEELPYYEKTLVADDDDYLLECVEQLKAEMPFL